MGGPDTFTIQLEGPGIYFEGQSVKGNVHISNRQDMPKIKHVAIKLFGDAGVFWQERVSENHTEYYGNHEDYICRQYILHQGHLAAGQHIFPFTFSLAR